MDTISLLLVFCILCSSVGSGLFVPRTRHNAGNEICSWQTLESFQQDSSNSLYPYVLLSLEESPRVSPSDDNACRVISLKTLGMDTLTRRSWAVSESEITYANRLQKVRIKLENSKVYIDGTWFRREIDEGETEHVKLEMLCLDNRSALIRKCAVFSLRNNIFSHKMDHIQRGRVLLEFAEENEVTSVEVLLVCIGVGVFSLIIILFLCTDRTCAKTLQNESYMEEEIIVNSTGSYHVKDSTSEQVDEERPEEVAQPETQTEKHERRRSASRESGIDEDTQQEGNEEKQLRLSTAEQENQDVQPENSELVSNSLAVAVTNTDNTFGIYEEVTKDCDSPRQTLEVPHLSQSGTEVPSVNLDSGQAGSEKSKRKKSKKNLKLNTKSAEAHRTDEDKSQPSSAGSKKGKKWFHKNDERKRSEVKPPEEEPMQHDAVPAVEEVKGTDCGYMSTPDVDAKRRSMRQPLPLPPSPVSPSVLPGASAVWQDFSADQDLETDELYEVVDQNDPMYDETYETFDDVNSDSDMYMSVDDNNRHTSLCASDTYESVTATVRSTSTGSIYESVDKEMDKAGLSPPIPPVEKIRALSTKRQTSCEDTENVEKTGGSAMIIHSPKRKSAPTEPPPPPPTQPIKPELTQEELFNLYAKPDMEKKRLSRKMKASSSPSYKDSANTTDYDTASQLLSKSPSDNDANDYEVVNPSNIKILQRNLDKELKAGENTSSGSPVDYAEVIKKSLKNGDKTGGSAPGAYTEDTKDSTSDGSLIPAPEYDEVLKKNYEQTERDDNVFDPYAVPPELPYRPPEIDEEMTQYEECGNVKPRPTNGEVNTVNDDEIPDYYSTTPVLPYRPPEIDLEYEECERRSRIDSPKQDTNSEGLYEELSQVSKGVVKSHKL